MKPQPVPLQGWLQQCREAVKGAEIVGLFHCRGDMSDALIEGMLKSGNPQFVAWASRAKDAPRGFPDTNALKWARKYVKEILEK